MILKEPKDINNCVHPVHFTKNARSAFLHILRTIRDEGYTLLLPAYIGMNSYEGSGVFDVVKISRIPHEFYPVGDDLAPVPENLAERNGKHALLIIHYFGFHPSNFTELLALSQEKNWLVIEDCAHTVSSSFEGKLLGSIGDFGFHSLHKVLPTSDGGILRVNNPKYNFTIDSAEEGIKVNTLGLFARADLNELSSRRRQNYQTYLSLLEGTDGIEFMQPYLGESTVPLNFPLRILDRKREEVYFELIERGVLTVALYYQLIPEVMNKGYESAEMISSQILNLPVHQDTTREDIERVCKELKSVLVK